MRLTNYPRGRRSTRSRRGRSNSGGTDRRSSRNSRRRDMSDRRAINTSGTLPRVSNNMPRHASSSLKKLRVPASHSLTTVTHRPLTHTKRAPQHRVRHMLHATITKQRIHKNRRLIIATARHVTSGSLHALTHRPLTHTKRAKERPHAPHRPGAAHVIARHQYKSFPHPHAPHKQPPTRRQRQTQGRT